MSDEVDGAFVFRFGTCELDESTGELRVSGASTEIEPRPRALLLCLLRQAGRMLTKEQLIDEVWGGRVIGETVVGNAVARARKAIGDADGKVIRNERNKGYIFSADVETRPAQRATNFELRAGSKIPGRGSWRLLERLGLGGAGEVWLCEDEERNRRVFKFSLGADYDGALKREVTLSRVLNAALEEDKRQNYVQILEWNIEVHPYHIEFEYAGVNLRAWAAQKGGLNNVSLSDRIDLIARIAAAVGDAHSVGVLHKDLKPDNILIDEREGRVQVRITDFGAGRLLTRERAEQLDITVRGWTVAHVDTKSGTMLWMAPELFEGGGATLQSDLYSLGVMLYQFVMGDFGRVLAPDWHPDVADQILRDDIDVVTKRNPQQRLADAHELARRLRSLELRRVDRQRRSEAEARSAKAEEIVRRARVRRPYLILAVTALAGGLIASTFFYYRQVQETRQARALAAFMTDDLLQTVMPSGGGSPSISLQDAMLKSVGLAQKRFANEPELENQILQVYDNTFSTLGQYGALEQVVQRQVQVDASLHGPHSTQTLSDRLMLANALLMQGKVSGARAELDEVRRFASGLANDPSFFPLWMQIEAQFSFQQADFMTAYGTMQRLITYYEKTLQASEHSNSSIDTAYVWAIQCLLYAGQAQQAANIASARLPILKAEGADADPLRLLTEETLYAAQRDLGDFDSAAKGFYGVCAEIDKQLGADNKDAVGCHQQQAQLDEDRGNWKSAADRLSTVNHVYHNIDGCTGTSMCIYIDADYAFALSRAGHADDAYEMAAKAVHDAGASSTPDPTTLPHALYIFARIALDDGRLNDASAAIDQFQKVIGLSSATRDPDWRGRYELLRAVQAAHLGRNADASRAALQAVALFKPVRSKALVEINDANSMVQ